MKLLYTVPAIILVLQGCSPDAAEAIGLHRKFKAHAGLYGDKRNVICGDFTCEGSETSSNCPRDCFVDTYSMKFDSTNEGADCSSYKTSGTYTTVSLSVWIKPTSMVFARVAGKTSPLEYSFFGRADNRVRFIQSSNSSNYCETAAGSIVAGNWYHIMGVWVGTGSSNATRCFIYINGVDSTSAYNGSIQSSWTAGTGQFKIGDSTGGLAATFGDTAVWYADMRSSVTTIYNSGHAGNIYSLSPDQWYRMGDHPSDNVQSTLTDNSSTGSYSCTISNTEAGDLVADVP